MVKSHQRIMRELAQPFNQSDLEFRPQQVSGTKDRPSVILLAYVTNRAMQQRLDDVVGCFGWKNEFLPLPNSVGDGALCGISLKIDNEWITKWDGAENTAIESIKGGLSVAMKRAVVQWGVGRYLYDVDVIWGHCISQEQYKALKRHEKHEYTYSLSKDKSFSFYWKPPKLDDKFLPQKYVTPTIAKTILELAKKTETNMTDTLNNYGVLDVRDLFSREAGEITSTLLKIQERQNEEKQYEQK